MGGRRRILAAIAATAACLPLRLAIAQNAPPNAPAPTPTAPPPATTPAAPRVLDPITVLRSATSTQAEKDEAARRLLLRRTPQARDAIVASLQDVANPRAQLAAASALAADDQTDPAYVIPLYALVGSQRADHADAAIAALANYRNDRNVVARLLDFASNAQHRASTRESAIRVVAGMSDKTAARTLVNIVTNEAEPQPVRVAAANGLADMTGRAIGLDPAAWQQWWTTNADRPNAEFERELLAARAVRLAKIQHRQARAAREMQEMLTSIYQSAPPQNRESILLQYLKHGQPDTRLVGVQLMQQDFKNNTPIPAVAREQLRNMVGDSSAQVRVAVAAALTLLNDPGAVAAVMEQLNQEPDANVRAELARTLAPTRDLKVVDPLLRLLRDPSPAVAQVAAEGLSELGPLIQKDAELARRVAQELREALQQRSGQQGTGPVRAALVDALGSLQNPALRVIFTPLLRPTEVVLVRRAAIRSLGKLQQPEAAEIIVNALEDSNADVRLEAIEALDTTATFAQAERLYSVVKSPEEKPAIRQRAWVVLRNRFPDPNASNEALARWADRFNNEPERKIEILEILAKRLSDAQNAEGLAVVQQNIGQAKMQLADAAIAQKELTRAQARASEADKYFEAALAHYRSKNPNDQGMITSALLEQRMDALLTSRQYTKATDFASGSIARNSGNQEAMGRKLRNEVDRLRTARDYNSAIQLIEAVNKMTPRLAEPFSSSIKTIETEVRQRIASGTGAQSAVGSGQ